MIPYVADQLAMRELPRATYALMVSLLPATATIIGVVVLAQLPSAAELAGVALVIVGVAYTGTASRLTTPRTLRVSSRPAGARERWPTPRARGEHYSAALTSRPGS